MDFGLEGKRAFVSGSTSGIGAGIARMVAAHGAHVVVHGRDAARAANMVAEIEAAGGTAMAVLGDVGSDEAVAAMVAKVDVTFGGIDILVSNAGEAQPFSPDWFAVEPAQFLESYNRNVVAAIRFARAFVPGMRERGWGRIILISSNSYTKPAVDFPAYPPGKAALVNLAVGWAKVLSNTGITSNVISPGAVLTETMASNLLPMAQAEGWADTDPTVIEHRLVTEKWPNHVGRMGRPDDIAAAVTFVASQMAGYMTGANIKIDGGDALSFG
jgi:NAD(P)-dependent dehydrogenase (short-subunit alcohol dehydrogenase family)